MEITYKSLFVMRSTFLPQRAILPFSMKTCLMLEPASIETLPKILLVLRSNLTTAVSEVKMS